MNCGLKFEIEADIFTGLKKDCFRVILFATFLWLIFNFLQNYLQFDQADIGSGHQGNMDYSPSDASSAFINNQADQSKHSNFQLTTSDWFIDYPKAKPQLYQSEPSKGSDPKKVRGRGDVLSESERKERKKLADRRYRMKKKMTLKAENSFLKMEFDRLTDEIKRLKEDITWLHPNRQLPAAQDLKKLEGYFSQATGQQHDNKSDSVQFNGLEMIHGRPDLHMINWITEGAAINEYLTKNEEDTLSGTCKERTSITELLSKIDADDNSNVKLSDFPGLFEEKCLAVGSCSLPLSLYATAQRIRDVHGDVTATSKMNAIVSQTIYILFCATIKEMDDLQLEQLSENKLLKWRDAIKDALRIGFQVEFAMEHLKKIAHAYVGLVLQQRLKSMAVNISKLEGELNARRDEHAKLFKQAKLYTDCLEEFGSKCLSTGLFP